MYVKIKQTSISLIDFLLVLHVSPARRNGYRCRLYDYDLVCTSIQGLGVVVGNNTHLEFRWGVSIQMNR